MMKIVIAAIHSQYIHSALAPWYLRAAVEAYSVRGLTAQVVEATINQPEDEVLRMWLEQEADVLGISCYIWNSALVERLLPRIAAAAPHTRLVLGGPEATFRAAELLERHPEIAYISLGEGERSFPALMDALDGGTGVEGIPGLAFVGEAGRVVIQPPVKSTEDPPDPYTPDYLAALQGRIAYLETSRGCPFSCAFCLSGREDPVRFFDLERAKRDLLTLANSGAKTVKLVDRTFNCHPARAYALLAYLIDCAAAKTIPPGVCFHFEVAADLFDDRTLSLLETAPPGLFQLEAGLQSFHAETLEAVTRQTDLDRLCGNLKRLLAPGNIHVHIDLIAGLPYEDWDEFGRSFDQAYALQPHMLQLGFLKLLPGSRLWREAEVYGYQYQPQPPYELIRGDWLGEEEIARLHRAEDALERLYNSGRFRGTLAYVQHVSGLAPFALFDGIGEALKGREIAGISLDAYTVLVQAALAALPGVDPVRLQDELVCDMLQSRRDGWLPSSLRPDPARIRQFKREATRLFPLEEGIRRGLAILYATDEVVMVEYRRADPVTGRYPLRRVSRSVFAGAAAADPPGECSRAEEAADRKTR